MTNENQPIIQRTIDTEGGAYIEGTVNPDSDFVARDKITYETTVETTVIVNSPEAAHQIVAEQTRKAALLGGNFARLPFEPECVIISPQKTTSPDFYIGKYPVTNSQYAAFLADNPAQSVPRRAGWHLKQPPRNKADHPVVGVSWHDAVAYCAWLSEATSRSYRLPSQAEWTKAASGPKAYHYPWGNEWQDNAANVESKGTTSVTAHPDGASAYGSEDMLGNVQEWTATHTAPGEYIHCGGYYGNMGHELHCGFHDSSPAETKVTWRGFRVLLEVI